VFAWFTVGCGFRPGGIIGEDPEGGEGIEAVELAEPGEGLAPASRHG